MGSDLGRADAPQAAGLRLEAAGEVALPPMRLTVELVVAAGEVVALIGPNGAGKSATLATLAGLLPLHHGHITLSGADGTAVLDDGRRRTPPDRRGLGWVPQLPSLLPRRPPLRQVLPFAHPRSPWWAGGRRRTAAALLEALDIDPADRRRPSQLSVGETQRIAVARALAAAAVVLCDEPTAAQDLAAAARIRRLLRRHADRGGAVLVTAHRPEDAYAAADRLVVLEAGRVTGAGTPAELAAAPATPYIARAVGANVLDGEVTADGVLVGPWGRLAVPPGTPPGPAVAVVRPAAITLHRHPPDRASARNLIPATVAGLHHGPAGVLVQLDADPPLVALVTPAAVTALDLRPGSQVVAAIKATDVGVTAR